MNYIDILIFVLFIIGFLLGYKDGLIRKLIGLAGFIAAVYFAVILSKGVGRAIENTFDIEYYLAEMLAGVLVFITIILLFSIIKRLVHPHDKVNNFINQVLGGVVGSLQMLLFISAALYLLGVFGIPEKQTARSSLLYSHVYQIIPATVDMVGGYTDSRQLIKEYINEKDTLK